MDNLAILLLLILFPLPFATLWYLGRQEDGDAEAVIDSVAIGTAISLCLLYVCALVSLRLFWGVWPAAAVIAAGAFYLARARNRLQASPEFRSLGVLVLIYLALRLVPTFVAPLPQGWDPYFHLVLADKVLQAEKLVYDWAPYEVTQVNYPLGSHALLALASLLLNVPLHTVFIVAMAVFGALTVLQTYVVAWRATGDRPVALYAAAAYAFTALLGSFDYPAWGGLPNLVGMYLFLCLLSQLMREDRWNGRSAAAFAMLFVALSLVHHHVMLAAAACLGWMLIYFLSRREAPRTRRLLQGLTLSAVLGSPYFAWYLLRSPSVADTGILAYVERSATDRNDLVTDFGPIFFFTVAFGVLLYLFGRSRHVVSPILLQSLVALLLSFAVLHHGSRWLSTLLLDREISPFTPSRFLTDAVPLLSVFAGIFLLQIEALLRKGRAFLLALVAASIGFHYPSYALQFEPVVRADNLAAFAWLRQHADRDALIFEENLAAAYLTRRAASSMPYPASEPRRNAEIRALVAEIKRANGKIPPSAGNRQIIALLAKDPRAVVSPSQLLWTHPTTGLMIIQWHPARFASEPGGSRK